MAREAFQRLLQELEEQILAMGSMVDKALGRSMDALLSADSHLARQVIDRDEEIDALRLVIEAACLQLIATQQPLASDLRTIAAALSIATDLERMGDHAEGIAHLTLRMSAEFPVKPPTGLLPMADGVRVLLREALDAFIQKDTGAAQHVLNADDSIDACYQDNLRVLLGHMIEDPRMITRATYLLWVDHNIERIGDRVCNIADRTIFMVTGAPARRHKHVAG